MISIATHRRGSWFAAVVLSVGTVLAACKSDNQASPSPADAGTTGATSAPTSAATTPSAATSAAAPTAPTGSAPTLKMQPPPVPNAAEAKKLSGSKIKFYGGSVGVGADLDKAMVKRFTEDTGIEVTVIPVPRDPTEIYATYQRLFQGRSSDIDVMMVDVIWPGAFGQHYVDLGPKLGEAAKQHVESIVKNNTVDGRLVAIPWFTDFGMLYYRTDLLQKYGFQKPPETWDELEQMAKKIMEGEKPGNPNFTGFVWQGKAYEGLTCNALEWISSHGGGIIEGGKSIVNSPAAATALDRARGWVGTISPVGVTGYEEEDARNAFQGGSAAFMRNWPYAYSMGNDEKSPIKGKFDVAPLPHQPGQKGAGTVGGWQLAVSKYSKSQDAAIELVRYLASPEGQEYRAVVGSAIPTIVSVQADEDVQRAMPFLRRVKDASLVTRPSSSTGTRYNEASIAFFQGVSQVLQGKPAAEILPQIDQRLQRVLR